MGAAGEARELLRRSRRRARLSEDLCVEQNGKCALGDDCACKRGDGTDNF